MSTRALISATKSIFCAILKIVLPMAASLELTIFNFEGNGPKMNVEEIGREIRRARLSRSLTQAQLAASAGITRTTLNQVENGSVQDLGIRKVESVLRQVGLSLEVRDVSTLRVPPDFLRLASTTASVSFKEELTDKELLRALMTGKVPKRRRPHMRMLLEEAPQELFRGLVRQVNRWARPGKIERNLDRIAVELGVGESANRRWRTN